MEMWERGEEIRTKEVKCGYLEVEKKREESKGNI
jgi:hypothetical protein